MTKVGGPGLTFELPLQEKYVVPARCSSCDAALPAQPHGYPLFIGAGKAVGSRPGPTLMLLLCDHCYRRRRWDSLGALVGLVLGIVIAALLFRAWGALGVLFSLLASGALVLGVAVGFSVVWLRLAEWTIGLPRFSSVLYSRPEEREFVEFLFRNSAYGERFREANERPPAA